MRTSAASMLALGLSLLILVFWTLVGRALLAALNLRLGVLRSWLLAPNIGLAVVLVLLMFLNQAGWPIGAFAWPMTLALGVAAAGGLVWRRALVPWRALLPFGCAALVSLAWTGWPAWRLGFNWISFVNDDFINYCLAADRFKDFGFFRPPTMEELAGRDYTQYYWFMHAPNLMRFGAEHLLAWTAGLTARKALEIFMPVILALGLAQIFGAAGIVLHAGRWRRHAQWTAALLCFSPLFMLGSLYQLIAQVGGLGLMITTVALLTARIAVVRRGPLLARAVAASIVGTALCLYYPEVTPFAVLTIGLFAAVEWARARRLPLGRVMLICYVLVGVCVLLRYNLISYIYTLAAQFSSGTRLVDLSLSLFPYFLIPSGLSCLFGLLPLQQEWPEPYGSGVILFSMGLLLTVLIVGLRRAWRPLPFASLLLVQLALAVQLFRQGSDFGLYKLAMFIQPALMAAVAAVLLALPRPRWTVPLAVAVLFACTLPAALTYTQASVGLKSGGFVEVQHASELLGTPRPAASPGAQVFSGIDNVAAAKLAANFYRGTDVHFLGRDFFWTTMVYKEGSPLIGLHPHREMFAQARRLLTERGSTLYAERTLFGTRFDVPLLSRPATDYLSLPSKLSPFNKLHATADEPRQFLHLRPASATHNLLAFVHSSKGNHYFLGDRSLISLFNQEWDRYNPEGDFNSIGRFLLLRIENPTAPFYLRLSLTKTFMGKDHTAWPTEAVVLGRQTVPLALHGNGAVNRFVGPIEPVWLEGAAYIAIDFRQTPTVFPYHRVGLNALYNTQVPLDYRRIIGFARDISAVSAEELAGLSRPTRVSAFPADLARATGLEYSGVYEDGWVSPAAEFVLGAAKPGDALHLRGYVPQLPNQDNNGTLLVGIGDAPPIRLSAHVGAFDWMLPLSPGPTTRLTLRFTKPGVLPNGDDRPVGAKLELLELAPEQASVDFNRTDRPRPASEGIDQDGWAGKHATFVLSARSEPATLVVRLEFPGWSGRDEGQVRFGLDGDAPKAQRLNPGFNEIRLPLQAADAARTVVLDFAEDFKLPAGDARQRSVRVLSIALQPAAQRK